MFVGLTWPLSTMFVGLTHLRVLRSWTPWPLSTVFVGLTWPLGTAFVGLTRPLGAVFVGRVSAAPPGGQQHQFCNTDDTSSWVYG